MEELHDLAKAIGLKRVWFQDTKVPHYDLTPSKRTKAIEYAAVEVPLRYMANFGDSKTKLVNLRTYKGKGYVRIDRRSMFGNPFVIGKDGTRDEVIEKYRAWFQKELESQDFTNAVESLRGRTLACWCAPKACHGDVIIEYLEGN